MSDSQVIGFAFFGAIAIFTALYFLFQYLFPRTTDYEWKKLRAAKSTWAKMLEGDK